MAGARLLDSAFFSGGGIQNRVGELQAFVDQRITLVAPQATEEGWDKVFPLSPKVEHDKVSFRNHFGITLAADLYKPRDARGRLPAVAVSGPFGAVKEQVSGLYAMRLAERGFLAVAFDPSYTGESGGEPRGVNSPDLNTEDFQAALDYLLTRDDVEEESLGVVGVCGWGGFALNVAAIDSRLRAAVAVTMYDMSQLHAGGYQDAQDNAAARHARRQELNRQRTRDARQGTYAVSPGFPSPMPEDAPQFLKDYYDFYCTPRGYHPRSIGSNGGWLVQTATSLLNARLLAYAREIQAPVLLVHGENAHSRYFSETAFQKMTGEKPAFPPGGFSCRSGNKELLLVPGAVHCDLYDERAGAIPFDRIADFLRQNLEKQP
ncbi:MAG: alpha/beta hydrolase [Oligosphaeraceae bacterium]